MVPWPEINIDVKNLLIDVLFKVDEGKQYHVRDVEIHGIDPQAERALKSQFGYGRVFDVAPFRNFFEEHKSGLPTDVSLDDAIQVRRDLANASVDIVLDFAPVPKCSGTYDRPALGKRRNRRSASRTCTFRDKLCSSIPEGLASNIS